MAETHGKPAGPIHFAGATLARHRHVCAFFHTRDEEYQVLLPFIREGFDQADRAFHIVDPKLREDHLERLRSADINVSETQQTGQLKVLNWEDSYLRDGHFDQYRMLALIEQVLGNDKPQAFGLTRLLGQMEWALESLPGVNDLLEYEARLNHILPRYPDPVI